MKYSRDLSKPLAPTFGSAKPKKKRTVVKYTTKDGTKIKSAESRSGKRVETAKNKTKDFKSRQVSKDGIIKKTVTRTPGRVEKEIERGKKRRVVSKGKI